MGAFETYAKRKAAKKAAGEPDVFEYDVIPAFLRKQVALIAQASLGPWYPPNGFGGHSPSGNDNWEGIAQIMEREFESFPDRDTDDDCQRCLFFLSSATNVEEWLSLVEIFCLLLWSLRERGKRHNIVHFGATQEWQDALDEINDRFREKGFGYEFTNGEIICIDEQFIHAEVVKPALALLAQVGFDKANEEFMTAHRHYREDHAKDAVVAANRAFESTLKAICEEKGWTYPHGARASDLVHARAKIGFVSGVLRCWIGRLHCGNENGIAGR